jgi:hypothetical protein
VDFGKTELDLSLCDFPWSDLCSNFIDNKVQVRVLGKRSFCY